MTQAIYNDLWGQHFANLTNQAIPDYGQFLISERMFEDYLDIFRGKNTRLIEHENIMPYPHPFFDGQNPKLKEKPCIKYIMIGEARPPHNPSNLNDCGGDTANTYFYNVTHVGNTRWLSAPYNAIVNPHFVAPNCPNDKIKLLLELAEKGYLLIDLFPYAIPFNNNLRQDLNDNGSSEHFFNIINNDVLPNLIQFGCENNRNICSTIIAFSGPPITHRFLAHQIANGQVHLNPNFTIFSIPNYLVIPVAIPNDLPPNTVPWYPTDQPLNEDIRYPKKQQVNFYPFYRCTCWDASFQGPHELFIRNAFNI
jgi:hypothetical protein